jgi:cysteine desulfurase
MDYNATTPLRPEVKAEMIQDFELYGNASSMHESGRKARARVEDSRRAVAELIGAKSGDIIFTSGGSESNNTVFQTMEAIIQGHLDIPGLEKGKNEIITSTIEHPCVMNSAKFLAEEGYKVTFVPVDPDGKLDMQAYKAALNEKTLLVSVMLANNEIGTIQDLAEISRLAKSVGAYVHSDAVQAAGKIPLDVDALGLDYATMSCHKIYGPKGVGALYVRNNGKQNAAPLFPLIHGGHQEDGARAGTYNNIGILGFGAAARCAKAGLAEYGKTLGALRTRLRDGLTAKTPHIKVNGHPTDVLPNTLNISFPGAEGEAILLSLDLAGIEVSTGSACASGSLDPSHVLMAIGASPELAHGSIRFSLGLGLSAEDIDYVIETLPPIIARLRSMSTMEE